jgi:hypothetical protein
MKVTLTNGERVNATVKLLQGIFTSYSEIRTKFTVNIMQIVNDFLIRLVESINHSELERRIRLLRTNKAVDMMGCGM